MTRRADALASWLFERLDVNSTPPIDLAHLARSMGVDRITEQDMAVEGRLEQDGKSAEIFLRRGQNVRRRRFTLAHELAHRAIVHNKSPLVAYRRAVDHDGEERLCDEIAAAILMPEWWMAGLRPRPNNLSTLRFISAKADVSLSAALVRQREVNYWQQSLLRFKLDEGRWRLQGASGIPAAWHRSVRSAPATHSLLENLHTRCDTNCDLPLIIGAHELTVAAQVDRSKWTALALVELDEQLSLLSPNLANRDKG